MQKIRKRHSASFKAQVALEAIRERKTLSQLSTEHSVHANQISQWKQQLLDNAEQLFSKTPPGQEKEKLQLEAELYQQIGQLKVELDWLKKKYKQPNKP